MIIDSRFSNNEHIVRTTEQWESTSVKYKIIPRGCLCVELTPDGKTKIKVGDGHKYYDQLPYIGGDIDIHEIIELIEEYVDSKEFMEIQEPIVPSVDALPSTGNDVGDVRFVTNDNPTSEHDLYIPYVWFNDKWNIVGGGNVDLSNYPTEDEMDEAINVVDDKVDELSETVGTLDEHITNVENEVSGLNETVSTFDDRITNVEDKVSELDEKVKEIGETVETFDDRITNVEDKAHTHSNKEILDNTTASFTTQEETKLAGIEDHANNYSLPKASDTELGGIKVGEGLTIDSETGVLSADGSSYELPPATTTELGGVIVGDGLSVDEDGTLSANEYIAGTGIAIQSVDTSEYVTSNEYYSIDVTGISTIGDRTYWLTTARAALPKYGFVAFNTKGTSGSTIWSGPILISKNAEAVRFTCSYGTDVARSLTYNNETWYYSESSYWMPSTDVSGSLKKIDFNQEHVTESFIINYIHQFLDEIYNTSSHFIVNTGVLDVTKNNNDDLVISKESGDTIIQLDHYTLPKATDSTLGGVIVGDNISVDENGTISTHAPYELPPATDVELGGVIVGDGLDITEEGVLSVTGGGSGITVDDELSTTSTNPVQNRVITNAIMNIMSTLTQLASAVAALEAKVDELIGGGGTPSPGMPVVKAIGLTETIIGESNETVVTYNLNDYNVQQAAYSDSTGDVTPNSSKTTQLGTIDYIPIPDNAVSFTLSGIDVTHDKVLQFFVYVYNDAYAYVGDIGYYTDWYANNTEKYLTYGINKYIRVGMKHASSPSTITAEDISATITFRCIS